MVKLTSWAKSEAEAETASASALVLMRLGFRFIRKSVRMKGS